MLSWLLVVLGVLVTYVSTAVTPGISTWTSALALGTGWWTLAFGGRIPIADGWVTLAPLGVTALAFVLVRATMRRLAVKTVAGAAIAAVAYAISVAVLGLVGGRGSGVHVIGALALAALAGGSLLKAGAADLPDGARRAYERIPPVARLGARAAVAAVRASVAAGAVVVGLALVLSWEKMAAIHASLEPDVASGIILTLAQAAYLPNLVVWALAWVAGPGFAVGTGTTYSVLGTTTELLPAIPVLGALPEPGGSHPWVTIIPLILGMLVGWRQTRHRTVTDWRDVPRAALSFAVTAGVILMLLGLAASGSIGPGRMATAGVQAALLAFILAAGLAVGYGAALLAHLPTTRAELRRLLSRAAPVTLSDPPAADVSAAPPVPTAASTATAPSALTPDGSDPVR